MEVLNDLLYCDNMKIYQDDDYFKFSLDGVILSSFVDVKLKTKKILDIGAGTGIISLLLANRTNCSIDSVEIQKELCSLFLKSIKYNKLENSINLYNEDIKKYAKRKENLNKYNIIISNPPYYNGKNSKTKEKTFARNEKVLNLEDVVMCSRKMLKDKGALYLVFDSKRMDYLFNMLDKYNFKVKKIQFVHYNERKKSSFFLVESTKNGNYEMEVIEPFILYNQDGSISEKYLEILNGRN